MKQEADREEEEARRRAKLEEERQLVERMQMELDAKQAKLDKVMHARAGNFDSSEFVPAEPAPRTRYIPQEEQMPAASSALLDKMQAELSSVKSQLSKAQDEIARLEVEVRKEREQKEALSATVESLRRELEKARSTSQLPLFLQHRWSGLQSHQEITPLYLFTTHPLPMYLPILRLAMQ